MDALTNRAQLREAWVRGLRVLGVRQGQVVLVAGTVPGLDNLPGTVDAVIGAFLDAVGPEGTVAMHVGENIGGYPRPLFFQDSSPSEQGRLSEEFRRHPEAKRSPEPTMSVAAIGRLADELTRRHDGDERRDSPWGDRALGHDSPWQRLYEWNALHILIGGDWRQAVVVRLAQTMYAESMRGKYRPDVPFPMFDAALMGSDLEADGLVGTTTIASTIVSAVGVKVLVDRALDRFRKDPSRYFPDQKQDAFGFMRWFHSLPRLERRLQIGFGKVSITPEHLLGFRGVHRKIWARAVVVGDTRQRVCLIVADQAAVYLEHVAEVRRRVADRCGIPPDNIIVACTHAHRVPPIVHRLTAVRYPGYIGRLLDGLAGAATQAAAASRPARVGVSKVRTEGIVVNRRMKLIDGRVATSRYTVPSTWYIPPELIEGTGPVDPWLTTLRVDDLDGRLLGAVGNFTGHPIVALRSKFISGDCFGHAEDLAELTHPDAVAMLTNGAEGNVLVRGPVPERGPRYDPQAERVGLLIGGYWLAAIARAEPADGGSVSAVRAEVELPLRPSSLEWLHDVPTGDAVPTDGANAAAVPILGPGERPGMFSNHPLITPAIKARALERGTWLTEVQAIRINDIVLLGIPGEPFVEAQLMIKAKSPFPHTVVMGLANDFPGYLPTREAFAEGGYEVDGWPGRISVTEEALNLLSGTGLKLIDRLWTEYEARGEHA